MEFHDWSLLDHSSKMVKAKFAIRETGGASFEIDLDGNRINLPSSRTKKNNWRSTSMSKGGTPEALVLWLDRQVRQPDINPSELLRWLRDNWSAT